MCRMPHAPVALLAIALAPVLARAQTGSPRWTAPLLTALASDDDAARRSARTQLMAAVDAPAAPATYPGTVAKSLLPMLQSPNPRVRLNAAVLAEHFALKTSDPGFAVVAAALLKEKSEPLVLWGVKAAGPYIAAGNAGLARQVADAVAAHPGSGPIAEEAYAALTSTGASAAGPGAISSLPALLRVVEIRTAVYANGAAPPGRWAEASVPVFLSITCWPRADPVRRRQILLALDRLACAAAQCPEAATSEGTVAKLVREAAAGLAVIGAELNDAALLNAAKALESGNLGPGGAMPAVCRALDQAATAAAAK